MESLFLSWMFDKRWLCSLVNPCFEFILVIPLVVNLVTIVGIIYERSIIKIEMDSYFIILMVAYVLLAILCLFLLIRTYMLSEEKLKNSHQNYEAIRYFIHSFEGKKGIWSWIGICVMVLSIIQIVINKMYISLNESIYGCFTNLTRFYLDIAAWSYICLVIILFLILKLAFLLMAWRNPQKYLQYKTVI